MFFCRNPTSKETMGEIKSTNPLMSSGTLELTIELKVKPMIIGLCLSFLKKYIVGRLFLLNMHSLSETSTESLEGKSSEAWAFIPCLKYIY